MDMLSSLQSLQALRRKELGFPIQGDTDRDVYIGHLVHESDRVFLHVGSASECPSAAVTAAYLELDNEKTLRFSQKIVQV